MVTKAFHAYKNEKFHIKIIHFILRAHGFYPGLLLNTSNDWGLDGFCYSCCIAQSSYRGIQKKVKSTKERNEHVKTDSTTSEI